jgi:hypothetical protein
MKLLHYDYGNSDQKHCSWHNSKIIVCWTNRKLIIHVHQWMSIHCVLVFMGMRWYQKSRFLTHMHEKTKLPTNFKNKVNLNLIFKLSVLNFFQLTKTLALTIIFKWPALQGGLLSKQIFQRKRQHTTMNTRCVLQDYSNLGTSL